MPKQHIVLLLFLGAGLMTVVPPAGAQPNQVKQALKQTEKRAVKAAQKTAVAQQEAFEKILLNRAVSSWEKRQKQPSVSFEPTPPDKLATFIFPLNEVQKRRAKQYYYEAMRQFAELKKGPISGITFIDTRGFAGEGRGDAGVAELQLDVLACFTHELVAPIFQV